MNGLARGPGGGLPSDGPATIRQQAGLTSRAAQARTPAGRRANRGISAERAIDLCRAEVRTRAERDYNLRNIDITAAAVDAAAGRSDWVTGNFRDRTGYFPRAGGYRFNCPMDYNSGRVRTIEILRADGTVLQPGSTSGTSTPHS